MKRRRMRCRPDRHWRTDQALRFERVRQALRRRGLEFTTDDWDRLHRWESEGYWSDRLNLRRVWLSLGGRLEKRDGRLELSKAITRG